MTAWRLHTNTRGGDISDYCLENNVAAMGWSFHELLDGSNPALDEKVKQIRTYEDFLECAEEHGYKRMSVPRLHDKVLAGDVIWIYSYSQKHYYLAKVSEASQWRFCHEARNIDASNQLTDIRWYAIEDNNPAPDALEYWFKLQHTLQRIIDTDVEAFSLWLWRALSK